MKKFLSILAATAFLPAAASALCDEPDLSANDTVMSLLPNNQGNTMSGPAQNVGSSHRRWKGTLYYSESDNMLLVCDGANWVDVVSGEYGEDGADGAGTAGEAAPSKTQAYGPFYWTSGVRTFGTIMHNQPSEVVARIRLTGSDTNNNCYVSYASGGSWHEVARASATTEQRETGGGNFREFDVDGSAYAEVRALKQPNGQYKFIQYGGASIGTVPEIRHNNSLAATRTGSFPGDFRVHGDDDCQVSVMIENTSE